MKKTLLVIVILSVVLVSWMLLRNKKADVVLGTPAPVVSPTSTPLASPVISKNVVTYTDSGYMPNMITIKKGEIVTWGNKSGIKMWTASAMHPAHKVYPGTDIAACGAQTLLPMFDACRGVASGQSWSFKFDNVGTWKYPNHSNSSHFGTVVVE